MVSSWQDEPDGRKSAYLDAVPRVANTWSDTNLGDDAAKQGPFQRLTCRECAGVSFEVLQTGEWETSARCDGCGMYFIVHSG